MQKNSSIGDARRVGQAITLLTWPTHYFVLRPVFSFLDPLCGDPRDLTGFNSITAGEKQPYFPLLVETFVMMA